VEGDVILNGVRLERNVLLTEQRRKSKWIGHITLWNCPLEHSTEGKLEETRSRGGRCKQLVDDLKEKRKQN
jgi:hypothetical protein